MMKTIIMSLFIVLISPLLIQCSYVNIVYIQNNMDFDIKVYSRSNRSYIYFARNNDKSFPRDNSLNYIIIKSSQIHDFYFTIDGSFYSTDEMYEELVDDYDGDVDYYIENMDTNEIILRRENLINNPLATFVRLEKGSWVLILDEYE